MILGCLCHRIYGGLEGLQWRIGQRVWWYLEGNPDNVKVGIMRQKWGLERVTYE